MQDLINHLQLKTSVDKRDIDLLESLFVFQKVDPNTILSREGQVERYAYFLSKGIIKGYHNIGGKIVIEQLMGAGDFFCSFDSFMHETPARDNFETITACEVYKISKHDFLLWQAAADKWINYIQEVVNDHLNSKLHRLRDFQTLTAKERYMKFMDNHPALALQVKVEIIASFLGIEPQSLSRIRRQITI